MKSVLMSIQPKWCELIASGKKTIEVRKTKPKLETPFKVYIYATKSGDRLLVKPNGVFEIAKDITGKVIGEFVCDWTCDWYPHHITTLFGNKDGYFILEDDLKSSCLTYEEIANYGNGKTMYGWHISNLVIYDKPRELREFFIPIKDYWESYEPQSKYFNGCWKKPIKRPPQSWCYCESEVEGG